MYTAVVKIPGWAFLRRVTPLRIAVVIALLFATADFCIEMRWFSKGPLSPSGFIRLLDAKALDLKFMTRGETNKRAPNVVIAGLDEKSMERFGLWPWSRRVVAELIDKLNAGGAKVIAFDAVFADEDRNSSYTSVKHFVDAFSEKQLSPDVGPQKEISDDVRGALSGVVDLRAALSDLETRARETPNGRQLAAAIAKLKAENERVAKSLNRVRDESGLLSQKTSEYLNTMKQEIESISPDEALAQAVKRAQDRVVMGYFFLNASDFKEISDASLAPGREQLRRSAIPGLFEISYIDQPDGKAIAATKAVDVNWRELLKRLSIQEPRPNHPKIAEYAKTFGAFNANGDPDGVVRGIEMLRKYNQGLYPSLSLAAVARYYDKDIATEILPAEGLLPGETVSQIHIGPELTDHSVPVNKDGAMYVNWQGRPESYIKALSAADIIDGTEPVESYKDKIVFVGLTAVGTYDFRVMPVSKASAGVYLHAVAAQNIIDNNFLVRQDDIVPIELIGYILLGILMGVVLPRLPAWASIIGILAFGIGLYWLDYAFIFSRGIWVLNVLPTLQVSLTTASIIAYKFLTEGREKRQIRRAFQHYLNKTVVDMVIKDPSRLKLGGERRECTVFFSDVRGFTTLSEKLAPEQLVHVLNTYLTPMTDLIFKYDGTLDKYIGDAIMAFFNAPIDQPDHAIRACHVSLDMMEELGRLQQAWRAEGMNEVIDVGIGLNSGPMVVGNMGTPNYFNYTAMGDTVNLGSRLEGINKEYGTNIIISHSTYTGAMQSVHVREMDLVKVKGKNEPVNIYELLGKGAPAGITKDLMEQWARGLTLYRSQRWDEATDVFEMIRRDIKPNDGPCATYIYRCNLLRAEPPGADWNGVWKMTTK